MVSMQAYGADSLFLAIGTANGMFLRATVEESTGQLLDTRKKSVAASLSAMPSPLSLLADLSACTRRFLGTRAVRMTKVSVHQKPALLLLSSRPWLAYNHQGAFKVHALAYSSLDSAASFASERCPEGVVSLSRNVLRIFTPDHLGEQFHHTSIPLRYTPRAAVIHPIYKIFVVAETDHNALPYAEKLGLREVQSRAILAKKELPDDAMATDEDEAAQQEADAAEEAELQGLDPVAKAVAKLERRMPESQYGAPRPGPGRWASCVRLLDVTQQKTLDLVELTNNEAAFSLCTCAFRDHSGEVFICVGIGRDVTLRPKREAKSGGTIRVYRINAQGRLEMVSDRTVEDAPTAMCAFQGRLLVGVGNALRIYDLGQRTNQLLRKCENRNFPNTIATISHIGERIIVGDVQESIFYVKYSRPDNSLYVFCDDMVPRWITSHVCPPPSTAGRNC